jgi:hypothetical protein
MLIAQLAPVLRDARKHAPFGQAVSTCIDTQGAEPTGLRPALVSGTPPPERDPKKSSGYQTEWQRCVVGVLRIGAGAMGYCAFDEVGRFLEDLQKTGEEVIPQGTYVLT